jgi:pilus assembly protein Flp/PilA
MFSSKFVNETTRVADDKSVMFSELSMTELFASVHAHLRMRQILIQESGATAVEYALMVGLMAMAIIGGVTYFGGRVSREFNVIANTMPTGAG